MPRSNPELRLNLLDLLLVLTRWKRFLILHTLFWAVAAACVAMVLPKKYTAQVVLMPPKSSSSGLSKLAKNFPIMKMAGGAAANLLPMGGGEDLENVYLAILSSRTLQMEAIEKFDLVKVYKFDKKKKWFIEDLLREVSRHVGVEVADEGTFIISVWDKSPQRAADMANFMADRLDEIYKRLTVETERNQRVFLEERLRLTKIDLDSAETAYTRFLKDNRMLDIEEQARATIDAGTEIEARYLAAELKLDINRKVFGPGNPRIREQEMELAQLRRQRESLMKDRKSDLLIPYSQAPELGLQLVRLKRNLKIQETLFEFILTQYETSKFEESKNTPNVQVLDRAVPPQKRTAPKRSKIVLAVTAFSVLLGIALVAAVEVFRRFRSSRPEDYLTLRQIGTNLWSKSPTSV